MSTPKPTPRDPLADEETAQEQAVGTEPSGYRGDNPSTAGLGTTKVSSDTPENRKGHISANAPGNTGTTPGSTLDE